MRLSGMCQICAATATATAIFVSGCGKSESAKTADNGRGSPVLSVPNGAPAAPKLDQPFSEAVWEESPGNQQPPTDMTRAGQSTAKLRVEVQKLWETIKFTTSTGKTIVHVAHVDTEFGKFKVELQHDIAPNHVRNFVALAKAGYYNGLMFEHILQAPNEDTPDSLVELVEGGCPLGTGEPGIGHLGYWLKPEFNDAIKHEPGTLGAYHDDNPDSAACRFYIALTKAPAMDGNFTAFGKVVSGLDVVRTISKQPRIDGSVQPVKPALIRSVTIETVEVR